MPGPTRRRIHRPWWVFLALTVVVSACAPSAGLPAALPPVSPAPATAPDLPASSFAAAPVAIDGAAPIESAARAYYAAMHRALATGNVRPYLAVTSPGCACRKFARTLRDVYAHGRIKNGRLQLEDLSVAVIRGDTAKVTTGYTTAAYAVVRKGRSKAYPATRYASELSLARRGERWFVINETLLEAVRS